MSIKKQENIYFDQRVKRLVEVNKFAKQITLHDERYYQRDEFTFYPSVTHVLSYFPKAKFFENWIKEVGFNADIIIRRAGEEGTQVHGLIEQFLAGEELRWIDEEGKVLYNTDIWRMVTKFVEFWNTYNPKLIASEVPLVSDTLKTAGTGDIVCEIANVNWLLDIKTSNALHRTFDLQTAVYTQAWNETHNIQIERRGIIWLKSTKRGPSKSGKQMQGDGWEVRESERTLEEDLELFKLAYRMFELENPDSRPSTEKLPTVLKLKK